MQENEIFVVDLTSANTSGEIINNISLALEIPNAAGKKIFLKLKDAILNKSQLLSIQSLISSYGSTLSKVETQSLLTYEVCNALEIPVSKPADYGVNSEAVSNTQENTSDTKESFIQTPSEFAAKAPEQFFEVKSPEELFGEQISINLEDSEQLQQKPWNNEEFTPMAPDEKGPEVVDDFMHFQNEAKEGGQQQFFEMPQMDNVQPPSEIPFLKDGDESIFEDALTPASDIGERKIIGVYKKANEEKDEDYYEEVDFYAPPTDEPVVIDSKQTIYVTQTLRSGQILEFDGNIIIIGDCHPGSEIKASGDITVWGVLGSIAHAGIKGNRDAKIRALKMHAVQIRIADCYSRRPDGDNIPYIVKSHTFTPEEARIVDDGIVLFKI